MKPLDRAEALLASLAREPKTFYALYRTTLGCAYTSLERALKELQGGGLIEEAKKEKIGREKNIHRNREGEATANTDQESSTIVISCGLL
jgi:hypothetical protein